MPFPLINPKPTFTDGDGVPLVNGTVEFRDPATDLPKSTYPTADDAAVPQNPNPDVITLDGRGEAPQGIFLLDAQSYKMELKTEAGASIYVVDDVESPISGLGTGGAQFVGISDTGGHYNATNVEDALAELASTTSGEGASIIAIEDAAGEFTATDVEGALAEIWTDFASTSTSLGASKVGVEDAGGAFTGTDVAAVLTELASSAGVTKFKTTTESVNSGGTGITLQADDELAGWALVLGARYSIEGFLAGTQNVGKFKYQFVFTNAAFAGTYATHATDSGTPTTENDYKTSMASVTELTTLGDTNGFGIWIRGQFKANASVGGTVDLQWAQQAASANNTSLFQGSWITITRLD